MDLRERKRGLRSTSGDDGHENPVESCLALHEMDLKPLHLHCDLLWTAAIAEKRRYVPMLLPTRQAFRAKQAFLRPHQHANRCQRSFSRNCGLWQEHVLMVHPQNWLDVRTRAGSIEDLLEEGDGAGEDFLFAAGDEVVFAVDFDQGGAVAVGFEVLLAAPHGDD